MHSALVGKMVKYVVDGTVVFSGLCRYVTKDGWAGIRNEGDRTDECRADMCVVVGF